ALRTAPGWDPSFYMHESPPLSALIVDRGFYDRHIAPRPALAAAGIFRRALRAAGIAVDGTAKAARAGGRPLTWLPSPPLGAILRRAWTDARLRPYFYDALAVAGRTGTLEHRMLAAPALGNVRAKTGTTHLASALSGYVSDRYAFAVIQNANPMPFWSARQAQ